MTYIIQQIDKEAKAEVDQAVEEAKASPEPEPKDLWTDVYYKGTEPTFMRGREREEVRSLMFKTSLHSLMMSRFFLGRSITIELTLWLHDYIFLLHYVWGCEEMRS
jgi:hypothetical protein